MRRRSSQSLGVSEIRAYLAYNILVSSPCFHCDRKYRPVPEFIRQNEKQHSDWSVEIDYQSTFDAGNLSDRVRVAATWSGFIEIGASLNINHLSSVTFFYLTQVASRAVFVTAGLIFLVSGVLGKLGAFLTMIPDPVLGGVLLVGFGLVTSVGLSNMQFVNMTSSRNLTIIGSAMLIGLMVPEYLSKYPDVINTGAPLILFVDALYLTQ